MLAKLLLGSTALTSVATATPASGQGAIIYYADGEVVPDDPFTLESWGSIGAGPNATIFLSRDAPSFGPPSG